MAIRLVAGRVVLHLLADTICIVCRKVTRLVERLDVSEGYLSEGEAVGRTLVQPYSLVFRQLHTHSQFIKSSTFFHSKVIFNWLWGLLLFPSSLAKFQILRYEVNFVNKGTAVTAGIFLFKKRLRVTTCQASDSFIRKMNSNLSLCGNCKAVDVALLLSKSREKVALGPLLEIEQRKNYFFCDFVKRAIHQQHDDFLSAEFWADCKVRERQVDCYLDDFVLKSPEPARSQRCGIFIKTDPELRFSKLYRNFLAFDHPTFQLLANDRRSQDAYLKAQEILPQIDWGLPLRWLQICEKIHPYMPRKINEIGLIDLDKKCLVSNPQYCRYFALSYVWGCNQRVTLNELNL